MLLFRGVGLGNAQGAIDSCAWRGFQNPTEMTDGTHMPIPCCTLQGKDIINRKVLFLIELQDLFDHVKDVLMLIQGGPGKIHHA